MSTVPSSTSSSIPLPPSRTSSSSRASLSADTLAAHPLLASPPGDMLNGGSTIRDVALAGGSTTTSSGSPGSYAVYTGAARRKSFTLPAQPEPAPTTPAANLPPTPSSPSTASPTPPLLSRPSSSSLPHNNVRSSSPRQSSEAKDMLRGQNLKALVQTLGLSNESCGWGMIQLLAQLGSEAEWATVLTTLESGKVVLLLPAEKLPGVLRVSPAFFLDHMVWIDPPVASTSRTGVDSGRGIVTLSGFRGTIDDDTLVLASCGTSLPESTRPLNYTEPQLQRYISGLVKPTTRIGTTSSSRFPTTTLLSPITELSVPRSPRSSTSSSSIPPKLPPRSGTSSRLAALFAKPTDSDPSSPSHPPPPLSDFATPASTPESKLVVQVLAITSVLRHSDIVKSIGKSLETQLRDSISSLPGCADEKALADHVCAFARTFTPPSSWTSSSPFSGKTSVAGDSCYAREVEDVADVYQEMMYCVRNELSRIVREKNTKEREAAGTGAELEADDAALLEERIDVALESIEELVTTALYDKIFSPPHSADAQLDENLASRIAALNILELSLEHLGLDLEKAGRWDESGRSMRDGLEDIIALAATELAKLQEPEMRSPRAKLGVFTSVHKIIVDNLSRLPPIPLKDTQPAIPGSSRVALADVEMDDAASRPSHRRVASDIPVIQLASPTSSVQSRSASPSPAHSALTEASSTSVFSSQSPTPTPSSSSSSADLILPILICLVVQSSPPHLPSHILFIQRFRTDALFRGMEAYCATSMDAVVEFIAGVDLRALGMGEGSIEELTRSTSHTTTKPGSLSPAGISRLPSRTTVTQVTQELDKFVDEANVALLKTLSSSIRLLSIGSRGASKTIEDVKSVLDGAGSRAKVSILRRGSKEGVPKEMSDIVGEGGEEGKESGERPSIGDRLASIPGLGRFRSGSGSSSMEGKRGSGSATPVTSGLFSAFNPNALRQTQSSSPSSPDSRPVPLPPSTDYTGRIRPVQRFLECEPGELRLNEVGELLLEYRRLAEVVMRMQG